MTQRTTELHAGWNFDNSYARLPEVLYTKQNPVPVKAPAIVVLNKPLAKALGLDVDALCGEEGVQTFAGNHIPDGALPIAQAYAGHQFGNFTKLGDGRAVLLGEQVTPLGERFDIQLKGSGRTVYSRGGDGRAALGPMLREYIISEAMHGLGIPTTRSLTVVTTGESVMRETILPGAILTRVADSHIRVGTFQYVAAWGTIDDLRALADYTVARHYPEIVEDDDRYRMFLQRVMERQAALIAKWQSVGFIHGVMNTDNMAISGETIDYGPCAFMDTYDPATVFSSIDTQGRYAYANQPRIAAWNLTRFAETLLPLLDDDQDKAVEMAQSAIDSFEGMFRRYWLTALRAKLGMSSAESDDETLITNLLDMLHLHRIDYTNTFRALTLGKPQDTGLMDNPEFLQWIAQWRARLQREEDPGRSSTSSEEAALQRMRNANPAIIARNHRVEEALAAALEQGDYCVMEKLVEALAHPYAYSSDQDAYSSLPAETAQPFRTFCGT